MNSTAPSISAALTLVTFLCFAFCGCVPSSPRDAVSSFRASNPNESRRYTSILPTELDTYQALYELKSTVIQELGGSLKEKFASTPEVSNVADQVLKLERDATSAWTNFLTEVRSNAIGGGTICQFVWTDGSVQEAGILVIKGDRIVLRREFLREKAVKKAP